LLNRASVLFDQPLSETKVRLEDNVIELLVWDQPLSETKVRLEDHVIDLSAALKGAYLHELGI